MDVIEVIHPQAGISGRSKRTRTKEEETLKKRRQRKRRREERMELAKLAEGSGSSRSTSTKRRVVLNLLTSFHRQTRRIEDIMKKEILLEFLRDKTLENFIGEELTDLEAKSIVMRSIRDTMQTVKLSSSNDCLAAKNSALAMSVSNCADSQTSDKVSQREIGKVLGVHPRNLQKAKSKRAEIDYNGGKWVSYKRAKRNDALADEQIENIQKFWIENTRVSPNTKDVRTRRLERNVREEHAAHYLEESQVSFSICGA